MFVGPPSNVNNNLVVTAPLGPVTYVALISKLGGLGAKKGLAIVILPVGS